MNKQFRELQQDLCQQIVETMKSAHAGNAAARRWLGTTFPGHTLYFDTLWKQPAQPESIDSQLDDYRAEASELMRRLGEVQASITDLQRAAHAEKHAHLRQELVARRMEWEVQQAAAVNQANAERLAEEERQRQANIAQAEQHRANVAREYRERAERDAANMARKRRELQEAGYWPNN